HRPAASRSSGSSSRPRSFRTSSASIRTPSWPASASAPSPPAAAPPPAHLLRDGYWSVKSPAAQKVLGGFPSGGADSKREGSKHGGERWRGPGGGGRGLAARRARRDRGAPRVSRGPASRLVLP